MRKVHAAESAPVQSVKVLIIGNSLSNNARTYLPAFAAAGGKQIVIFPAIISGSSLEQHAHQLAAFEKDPGQKTGRPYKTLKTEGGGASKPCSLIEALDSDKWDYVTIQQLSGLSYKPESFEPAAGELIAAARKHAPQAKILAYQTWPYREDHPLFQTGSFTRQAMFEGIKTAYDGLASKYRARLIPVGQAFEIAAESPAWRFTFPDPAFDYKNPPPKALPQQPGNFYKGWSREGAKMHLDAKHANGMGCYLAGAVWYEVLFGEDVRAVDAKVSGIDPEKAADLRRIAHETVSVRKADHIPDAPAVQRLDAGHGAPAPVQPDTLPNGAKPPGADKAGGDE